MLFADVGGGLHVGVGNGLTADQVGAGLQADIGHVLRRLLPDAGLQSLQIDVALEGQVALTDQALPLHQLLHAAAQTGDVGLGGGEMVVHDNAVAGLDEAGGQDVLAGAALVGGQAVVDTEQLRQLLLHAEEGLAARIGVVRPQHGGLHVVAHGVDAGVRQHIQENIPVVELEGIEAGLPHLLQPLGRGQQL